MAKSTAVPPFQMHRGRAPVSRPSSVSLDQVRSKPKHQPIRLIFHATEGFGKTSFAAMFPDPVFLMAKGETGLLTLIDSGQLAETPYFPEVETWADATAAIRALIGQEHNFKTLVLDALGGFERLCHEAVCNREYSGDWGEKGFTSFQKGYEVALSDLRTFLALLDELRDKREMRIVITAHSRIYTFKNPLGTDYDRYEADCHKKTWSLFSKWADMVLFGNFYTAIDTQKGGKSKGFGGRERWVYAERDAAFDAKNRHGLPASFVFPSTPQAAFGVFAELMKKGKTE